MNNKFLPAEYDAIFPQGHDADDANIMAMLCFDRLRWPWQLSETAAGHYRAFLSANTGRVLARLLKAQDTDAVRALHGAGRAGQRRPLPRRLPLPPRPENAAAAALLADAEHKKYAPQPKNSGTILIFKQQKTPSVALRAPAPYKRKPLAVRVSFRFARGPIPEGLASRSDDWGSLQRGRGFK